MDSAPALDNVPMTLLSGFLGSGKTTLLRRVLRDPAFADTAVVVNEIGEIAIDHYLVDFVEGTVLELPGGCLCCAVREDLAQTLRALVERRDAGEVRRFHRIVIETSGLADPGPILFTLGTDPMLDQRLRLARVVTVVDAVTGAATLDRFAEAARQAAVADVLAVSKTDLAPFGPDLAARLNALNPAAARVVTAAAEPAELLFGRQAPHPNPPPPAGEGDSGGAPPLPPPPQAGEGRAAASFPPPPQAGEGRGGGTPHAEHSHGIASFVVVLEGEVSRLQFAQALGHLAMDRGNDLLRVKGLIRFADRPDRPAVVQAAQHAMFAPEWLDAWPDADRRSRLVFIVHDIAAAEILDRFAFASPSLAGPPAVPTHH